MAVNLNNLGDTLGKIGTKVGTFLDSNQAINGITDTFGNIFGKGAKEGESVFAAIKRAHTVGNAGEKLSAARIAGSAIGVGATARIASGGGLYRDANGNANLIGIPFI